MPPILQPYVAERCQIRVILYPFVAMGRADTGVTRFPQVCLLAQPSEAGPPDGSQPLDVLDAESEWMIGYLIE